MDAIVKTAKAGKSLRPWLSKTVRNPYYEDLALHSWNLTHFHLGENIGSDGFSDRTGELLFAMFEAASGQIFFIDVLDHGSFAKQHIIAIIENNWPEILEECDLTGLEIEKNYSDGDVAAFRKIGVDVVTKTPGGRAVVGLGGGISSAGTSFEVTGEMDMIHERLKQIEEALHEKALDIGKIVALSPGPPGDGIQLELIEYGPRLQIKEVSTGYVVVDDPLD